MTKEAKLRNRLVMLVLAADGCGGADATRWSPHGAVSVAPMSTSHTGGAITATFATNLK